MFQSRIVTNLAMSSFPRTKVVPTISVAMPPRLKIGGCACGRGQYRRGQWQCGPPQAQCQCAYGYGCTRAHSEWQIYLHNHTHSRCRWSFQNRLKCTPNHLSVSSNVLPIHAHSHSLLLGRTNCSYAVLNACRNWQKHGPVQRQRLKIANGHIPINAGITFAKSHIINNITRNFSHNRTAMGKDNVSVKDENEEVNEEDDDDDSSDDEVIMYKEDEGFPSKFREIKVHMKSLRLDSVIGGGLNVARNKVDDYFLDSKLLHNGEKVLKKSKKVFIGDYVDLIVAIEDERRKVKRVRILSVDNELTRGDRVKVHLRVWRNGVLLPD